MALHDRHVSNPQRATDMKRIFPLASTKRAFVAFETHNQKCHIGFAIGYTRPHGVDGGNFIVQTTED